MSANPTITANDIVVLIGNTLNIDVSGKITVLNILKKLSKIPNPDKFLDFIEERFNYERFRYLVGYQKFLALANEFQKENMKLNSDQKEKCVSYADKLYYKTISVFDEVNFMVQEGNDIRNKQVSNYIGKAFMKNPKQIKILEKVGKREELLRLCICNKPLLEQKILNALEELTLIKQYPQLAPKKDEAAINLIQNLQNRTRITK